MQCFFHTYREMHMTYIVNLPLTTDDFRQHPALETEPRHWLLDSVYGRQMLKIKLGLDRPDLKVLKLREQRELDPHLNVLIEMLGLRDWPAPRTMAERVKAFRLQLRMLVELVEGRPIPDWRNG